MRKIILLTVVILSAFAITAQCQTKPAKGSVIKFTEMGHDFGTINEGTMATHEFEFTNTGDSNLILINVQQSCGCTTPTWPHQPIKPGQKEKITVVYNSNGRPGQFNKSVTVTTNMKEDNIKIITIQGQVTPKPTPPPVTAPADQSAPIKIIQN